MFARVLTNAALAGGVLLGAVAMLATPGVALAGAVFGLVVGSLVGVWVSENVPGDAVSKARAGRRGGLLVGAGVFAGSLPLAGLILLLGPASGAVLIALAVATLVAWSGGRPDRHVVLSTNPWPTVQDRLLRAAQQLPDAQHHPEQLRPEIHAPQRDGPEPPEPVVGPEPMVGPVPIPANLSTAQLCRAWQRSYFVLLDLPAGAPRAALVNQRRGLLDEIECRDPDGFARWLDTGALAGSDPGRYLAGDQ